jgi:molecular chaperone DnaK
MGRRFDDPEVQRWARTLPYLVVPGPNGDAWVRVRGLEISPQVIAALILRELRRTAERFFGEPVRAAVITVPAWFDSAQRQAVKDASELAGLAVRRLVSEPTAAALGHGAHRGLDRRYAVCDLGGGTFDVSICDVAGGIFEVLAIAGDSMLGGDDVDRAVVEQLGALVRSTHQIDVLGDPAALMRLRAEAQRAKHALSDAAMVDVAVPRIARTRNGLHADLARVIRRDELELWASPTVKRIEAPCHAAMQRAGVDKDDIDEVLLVGGMTRMPAVRRKIAHIVGRDATVIQNPDEVVAIGAAIEIARLDGLIDGVLLLDVTARGLAIAGAGPDAPCDVLIPPGSVVPTREHRLVATGRDAQRELVFTLWEGESEEPARNSMLARYQVGELPDAPAGEVLVLVEVTVDVDGTCRVTAQEMVSGQRPPVHVLQQTGLERHALIALAARVEEWSQR